MHNLSQPLLILTSNARLARALQLAYAKENIENNQQSWQPLNVKTLENWLDEALSNAMLCGEIDSNTAPQKRLSAFEERLLWQQAITLNFKQSMLLDLFDLEGLAEACIEANRYMHAWHLRLSESVADFSDETRHFLAWQKTFQTLCKKHHALEHVRYFDWQIECLATGTITLPVSLAFAGFDQSAPQEAHLREVLANCGCQVCNLALGHAHEATLEHAVLADESEEMRCMVAWAKAKLTHNPQTILAMVVPNLATLRNHLADLLDDVFQPETVRPQLAEASRNYNFSLGFPLNQQAVISAALHLIRLFSSLQLNQTDISATLLSPYWSASEQEADERALLDATMRETLAQQTTWPRLMRFIEMQQTHLNISQLFVDVQTALTHMQSQARKQTPSAWGEAFKMLLQFLKWPGQRVESSHEYQAKQAWEKALTQFARLDFLGEPINASAASQLLQQICNAQVFQPETNNTPNIQILGMMEALSAPVDAMWVMGMNDDVWPPPARPNPLLPATIQRAARVANSDSDVQTAFAQVIHQRLLQSAEHIIFSSSLKQGEKVLRASPLMQGILQSVQTFKPANTLAELLAKLGNAQLSKLVDNVAPSVQEGEHVRGGTSLIRAQAICPAWAFYQFRLGAKTLKTPKNGLDAAERGQLVHGALEQFWHPTTYYRHFADLQSMTDEGMTAAIHLAVENAIAKFTATQDEIFSPAILSLEHERLCKLLLAWLNFEKSLQTTFNMYECEAEKKINIGGVEVTLKIDRIHQLPDGGLVLVDYKTGHLPKMKSWGEDRITEPQLPIYAVFYAAENVHVSSIQFGLVKVAEHGFFGVAASNFEAETSKRKPEFIRNFMDFEHLKAHWKTSIEALVQEVKSGQATVVFNSVADLIYCEVTPLLRLPERQLQFERQLAESGAQCE